MNQQENTHMNRIVKFVAMALMAIGAGCGLPSGDTQPPPPNPTFDERTLIGYSSELSVRPGDTIEFMVNAVNGGQYQADLVRIINGESVSRYGDLFELAEIEAPFAGEYQGSRQPLNLGSYIHVDDAGVLDRESSFTVGAWIYPVFDPTSYEPPDLDNVVAFEEPTVTIAPLIVDRPQTIVSRFDSDTGTGWALRLSANLQLEFVVGDGHGGVEVVTAPLHLHAWDWAYVAASYDADDRSVTVYLHERPYAPGDQFTARNVEHRSIVRTLPQEGPLRIAASRGGPGAAAARFEKPVDVFNGSIQDVRIVDRALDGNEIDALAAEVVPDELQRSVLVNFDFAQGIGSAKAVDISSSRLDGVVVNLPNRAVRGRFWDGSTINWSDNPDQYDAMTFYSDDLYDAEWNSDFLYRVPPNLPSGVYAARLRQGSFVEYITFFVAAPKGEPGARLAFWASDFDYLAYANVSFGVMAKGSYPGQNWNEADLAFMRDNTEYGTGGVYNAHVDGRTFGYGTRKRPDLQMKPGAMTYNLAADLHIVAFLEHHGIAYDVITDELVDEEGADLLAQYDVIVSSTHPEYVTTTIVDAITEYTAHGGRFMYIGGNGYFWSVGRHPTLPGVMESRNFFDIADRYLTNGKRGGLLVETGRHTGPVFGNEMSGMIFNGSSPYRKLEDADDPRASWIFQGTSEGEVFGDYGIDRVHGGAAGFEIDKFNPNNGVPRHALHLATPEKLRERVEDVETSMLPLTVSYHPSPADVHAKADIVFFETPQGGAMFSTGSITWMSSTLENNYDNDVARITLNVIRRFLDSTPFPPVTAPAVEEVDRAPSNPEYD
jgi:N,N-dimethylformamidase